MPASTLQDTEIYLRTFGRYFRVVAIATTDDEANEYCAAHPGMGVIANVPGELVFIADCNDEGVTDKQ